MSGRLAAGLMAGLLVAAGGSLQAQEPVRLYAAGSLRVALTEVAAAFEKQTGTAVTREFAADAATGGAVRPGGSVRPEPALPWQLRKST